VSLPLLLLSDPLLLHEELLHLLSLSLLQLGDHLVCATLGFFLLFPLLFSLSFQSLLRCLPATTVRFLDVNNNLPWLLLLILWILSPVIDRLLDAFLYISQLKVHLYLY